MKLGYYLVYPKQSDVKFADGSFDKTKSYLMGRKNKPHRFCPECSSSVLIDFSHGDDLPEEWRRLYAMNVGSLLHDCLDGCEVQSFACTAKTCFMIDRVLTCMMGTGSIVQGYRFDESQYQDDGWERAVATCL